MMSELIRVMVYGMVAVAITGPANADPSYYRRADRSLFNGTTQQGGFPRFVKCASIRLIDHCPTGTFTALHQMRFTIIGAHGVRFEDMQGLVDFFEEEPTGNHTIITGGLRLPYRHIADETGKWRKTLTDTISGKPIASPAPSEKADKQKEKASE